MYSTGTLGLTNGSTTVTGTGTAWVANLRAGWLLLIPGEGPQLVASVNSNTSITLARAYQGTTRAGVAYNAIPTGGILSEVVAQLQALLGTVQNTVDGAGAGKFGDGTQAIPGIRFAGDEDTGIRRSASNTLTIVTGGTDSLTITPAGLLTSTTAITQSALDATPGRLQKSGDWGMGAAYVPNMPAWPENGRVNGGLYQVYQDKDPTGSNFNSAVLAIPIGFDASSNPTLMLAISNNSELSRAYLGRKAHASAVPTWTRLITQKNIVGAVAQSSGEATGAVVERGSNANGEYVKFADGTMICTKTISGLGPVSTTAGSIFASATVTGGSFAAAFIDDPSVSLQPRASSSIWACRNSLGGPSFIGNFTLHSSSTNSSTTIAVTVTAIGRWF